MRTTAGAAVILPCLHNAHLPVQFLFTAVVHCRKFLFRRILRCKGRIPPDSHVCLFFQPRNFLGRYFCIKINRNRFFSHVETYIVTVVSAADNTGKDMLAGMVLHEVEPAFPVQTAFHFRPRFKRLVRRMQYYAVLFMYVQHCRAAQRPMVSGLSASLRVKIRPVQRNKKMFFFLLAIQHLCTKCRFICILII